MGSETVSVLSPLAAARAAAQKALGEKSPPRGSWLVLLSEVLKLAGPTAEFQQHAERAWSSATFSGSRHTIALEFSGREAIDAGEALIAALPDHEFTIRGQIVADAVIAAVEHEAGPPPRMTVEVELLLLEES